MSVTAYFYALYSTLLTVQLVKAWSSDAIELFIERILCELKHDW